MVLPTPMAVFVVLFNFAIGLVCLGIAQKIWHFREKLSRISRALLSTEQAIHRTLYGAPDKIYKAHRGAQTAQQRYAQLGVQVQKIQQIMTLLSFGQGVWRRRNFTAGAKTRPQRL